MWILILVAPLILLFFVWVSWDASRWLDLNEGVHGSDNLAVSDNHRSDDKTYRL